MVDNDGLFHQRGRHHKSLLRFVVQNDPVGQAQRFVLNTGEFLANSYRIAVADPPIGAVQDALGGITITFCPVAVDQIVHSVQRMKTAIDMLIGICLDGVAKGGDPLDLWEFLLDAQADLV